MYAIINKKTKEFVYGTDFRYHPHHQRTSKDEMLTFEYLDECEGAFEHRQCGKNYEIVEVEVKVKNKIENISTLWNYDEPYIVGETRQKAIDRIFGSK